MRFVFALLAAAFVAIAPPASAQTPPATQTIATSHLAAAQDALDAILLDTGALSAGSLQAFTILAPQFRGQITSSPVYAALSADRQRAVVSYIDRDMPRVAQEETLRGAPQIIERFAPDLAAIFDAPTLAGIAAFLRTPEGGAYFLRTVQDGVTSEASGSDVTTAPTSQEMAALAAFESSPAGAAFNARGAEMAALMSQVGQASTGAPHIAVRLRRDMCALIGDQCPPGWRQ
jgi:hypothetical protein